MLAFILIFILTVGFVVHYVRKIFRYFEFVSKFNGPPTVPIIGNALSLLKPPIEFLNYLLKMQQMYGSNIRLWVSYIPVICVSDPDDLQMLLSKNLEKHEHYRFLHDILGDGLISIEGQKWKIHRRIISPAFNLTKLADNFLSAFNDQNEKLVRKLQKHCDSNELIDIWDDINSTSFSTILETAMDYKADEENEYLKSREAITKATDLVCKRIFSVWLYFDFVFKLYTLIIGMSDVFDKSRALPKTILGKKIQNQMLNSNSQTKEERNDGMKPQCIVDILYELHNNEHYFTEKELEDEVLTLILAGSETTAIVVSFTLLMLAMKPDIQEKIHEELDSVFGSSKNPPTAEELNQLKFLTQCIKETMRRFSVAPFVGRQTDEDLKLKSGQIIPAGANIIISIIGLHLDEKIYSNPYTWNPNNFNDDVVAKRHPGAFVPFGSGARICLGYKYAILSLKAQLSTLLRNYRFTTTLSEENIELDFSIVLKSVNGYNIMLHSRR